MPFCCREHDYDVRWDYGEALRLDLLDDPLFAIARRELERLERSPKTPFERGHVFPADLEATHGAVTLYCNGTYNEPVILIDIAAHRDYPDQVAKSVAHEVVHAIQESEWEGEWADEAQAEELEL